MSEPESKLLAPNGVLSGRTVVIAHPGAELYGADRMALETAVGLKSLGAKVCVYVPNDGPLVELMENSGLDVRILASPVLRKSLLHWKYLFRLPINLCGGVVHAYRALKSHSADTVIANTITQPHWIVAGRLAGVFTVCHVRENESGNKRPVRFLLYLPLRFARAIVANSISTADAVGQNLGRAHPPVSVVYNGRDWTRYTNIARERRQHDPQQRIEILTIGRLSPRKGQDIAIRAIATLRNQGIDAYLTLVGDTFDGYDWYCDQLRELAEDLQISSRVSFVGFRDDISPFLERAHIAVVPSRVEPFGTVAAESMAAGLPTVVAGVQGLLEIVCSDEVGRTFRPGDAKSLAGVLKELILDAHDALRVAEAGSRSINARFSKDAYINGIAEVVALHIDEIAPA